MVAAESNFSFTVKHILGLKNDIAYSLLRFETQRFFNLAPHAIGIAERTNEN